MSCIENTFHFYIAYTYEYNEIVKSMDNALKNGKEKEKYFALDFLD